MTNLQERFDVLAKLISEEKIPVCDKYDAEGVTAVSSYNSDYNTFEVGGYAFKVLTEKEAYTAAREYIVDALWAFNVDFILKHTNFYNEVSDYVKQTYINSMSEMQTALCEGANPIVRALISDLDDFVDDAIAADGRGHFISMYDGVEYEADGYYVYIIE